MTVDLRIDALTYGGRGIGRHDGKAVFVPGVAPGDLVRCRIVREKKRHAEAEVDEILESAPGRREPPCPLFGRCGGCQWQHLPYDEQGRWKERIFFDLLRRQAGVEEEVLLPLVAAAGEWQYRSRAQFKCRQTGDGFVMGFYRPGSHFVVDVPYCAIAAAPLNEALARFRRWLPVSPCPERVPQVDMALDDEGAVRIVVHLLAGDQRRLAEYLGPRAEKAGYSLFFQSGRKESLARVTGREDLHILPQGAEGPRLAYGPGGFAQINLEQNRRLVAEVLDAASLTGSERILDLFCGMGNFSLPLARMAREVVGVEDYAPSIAKARENARRNGLSHADFVARRAEGALRGLAGKKGFDLVLLDPPRTGAYPVVEELLKARPRRLIYVSCDPPTLARDLEPLLHNGYRVLRCRPFDLFPQTYHTESVTLLEWGGPA